MCKVTNFIITHYTKNMKNILKKYIINCAYIIKFYHLLLKFLYQTLPSSHGNYRYCQIQGWILSNQCPDPHFILSVQLQPCSHPHLFLLSLFYLTNTSNLLQDCWIIAQGLWYFLIWGQIYQSVYQLIWYILILLKLDLNLLLQCFVLVPFSHVPSNF